MEFIYILFGIVTGIAVTFFFLKNRTGSLNRLFAEKEAILNQTISEQKAALNEKEKMLFELNGSYNSKVADYKNLEEKFNEHKKEVEDLRSKFTVEFKNLANEILEEKSKKFTEQNKTNISDILLPLGEKIKEFEKKVTDVYDKEAQQRFSLKEEVKRLAELNQQVSKEANNLTRALKGESKSQGMWGEMILENILEKSGLVKNREYFVQESFRTEDNKRLQPDIILKYPGDRNVIIDSKVSLTAFEKYISAEEESLREIARKEHMASVKGHIQELSAKKYQLIYNCTGLDFVMMFLPVEPAYFLTIQSDPDIWHYAYEKRILLISPTNLIAALKMVVSLWRQEYQNKNALEIARQSGELYDKFVGFAVDLEDIGTRLRQVQKSYDSSMNKLSLGKGSLVKKALDLKQLGLKTTKEFSPEILERTEMNGLNQ